MDTTWLQDNQGLITTLLTVIIGPLILRLAWTRADRALKVASVAQEQASASKTKAEASKTQADALMGEIQAAQAGFTFVDTRLKWMEGQMQALQTQVADGFALNLQIQGELRAARARIQKLEEQLLDTQEQAARWKQQSHAWEHYAVALESSMRIAPAPVQRQMDSRLDQLHSKRPEPLEEPKQKGET